MVIVEYIIPAVYLQPKSLQYTLACPALVHMCPNKRIYTIRKENPAPLSSLSLPPKIPLKSTSPKSTASSPLPGACGSALLLVLSCPALLGNVGNMLSGLGLGASFVK